MVSGTKRDLNGDWTTEQLVSSVGAVAGTTLFAGLKRESAVQS